MRALIRRFDHFLSRIYGLFVFCDDPDCLLRLRVRKAPHNIRLSDLDVIEQGDLVLEIHLWNDRIPPLPSDGPDLAWAARTNRMFIHSLRLVARWMSQDSRSQGVRAICGNTVLFYSGDRPTGIRMMERLGFMIFPYRNPLGRFGEFWDILYAWALMWSYNEVTLRHRHFLSTHRAEIWMPVESFFRRYGERKGVAT